MPIKIPNLFTYEDIRITQSPHQPQDGKAMDFAASSLICPFDGCRVTNVNEDFEQSWFDLVLPDGSVIRYVHGRPARGAGIYNKGDVFGIPYIGLYQSKVNLKFFGKTFPAHWHIAIKVDGVWDLLLNYMDRSLTLKQQASAGTWPDNTWETWSTYQDKFLNIENSDDMSKVQEIKQQAQDFLSGKITLDQVNMEINVDWKALVNNLGNEISSKDLQIRDLQMQVQTANAKIQKLDQEKTVVSAPLQPAQNMDAIVYPDITKLTPVEELKSEPVTVPNKPQAIVFETHGNPELTQNDLDKIKDIFRIKTVSENIEKASGIKIDEKQIKETSTYLANKVLDRLTSSRLWATIFGSGAISEISKDTQITIISILILVAMYVLSEVVIKLWKK